MRGSRSLEFDNHPQNEQMKQIYSQKLVDIRDPQTYALIGAAVDIHRQPGHGFLEAVYQEAEVIEFQTKKVPFEREVLLPIQYRNIFLPTHYRADFVWGYENPKSV
jgi:hypothetical protein